MSVRLVTLDPKWIDHGDRCGLGISFNCMTSHCKGRQWILFKNPLDGGPAYEGTCTKLMAEMIADEEWTGRDRGCGTIRWQRDGESFESLSLSPSVNAHDCGHHTLTNGVFQ